jgi:hypothetical protein
MRGSVLEELGGGCPERPRQFPKRGYARLLYLTCFYPYDRVDAYAGLFGQLPLGERGSTPRLPQLSGTLGTL